MKRGAPVAGVAVKEGVVLTAVEILTSALEDPRFSKKLFELDTHMATVIAGLSPDARVLVREARLACQGHRMTYDEPISVEGLVSNVGELLQQYTQNGGIRPFGVSMIVAGIDTTGPRLITTDPSGSYRGFKAAALGMNTEKGRELLEKKYRADMTLDEATSLAIETVKTAYANGLKPENIHVAVIPTESQLYRRLSNEEILKYF